MKSKPFRHLARLALPIGLAVPLASPTLASPEPSLTDAPPLQTRQVTSQSTRQFAQPPVLLSTRASANPRSQDGFYYFSIRLPEDAGQPLAAVTIDPQRSTRFDLEATEAFLGTPADAETSKTPVALGQVSRLEDSNAVQISFVQPVQPGATVTIGLKPSRTPQRRDYQFGVTAIPAVSSPRSDAFGEPQFLGYGEVSFAGQRYRDYPFWWREDGLLSTWGEGDRRVLFWDLPPEFDPRLRRRN